MITQIQGLGGHLQCLLRGRVFLFLQAKKWDIGIDQDSRTKMVSLEKGYDDFLLMGFR